MSSAIDHVAVYVEDLEQTLEFLADTFGLVVERRVEVPEKRVRAAFLPWGAILLEVVEAAAVAPATAPGSINHLAIAVDDLDDALAILARLGIEAETDQPIVVAGRRTAYTKPSPNWPARMQLFKQEA